MTVHFNTVAIIGVGLIGGSLAKDLKKLGLVNKIRGAGRTRANLEQAQSLGLLDEIFDEPAEAARGADLIVLCTPMRSMHELIKDMAGSLKEGAIISDVGSTKNKLIKEVLPLLPDGVHFVPGHPIAGSEKTGAEATVNDLFRNRLVILTPIPQTNQEALSKVRLMWEAIGAKVEIMDPLLHDKTLGAVSHLPHMVAYALIDTIMRWDEEYPMLRFSAGGLNDFTRIAASSPEMWRDICMDNREAVLEAIDGFQTVLSDLRGLIDKKDGEGLLELFARLRQVKEQLKLR